MKSTTFEPQDIPNKDLSGISRNRYRVYSDPDNYIMVEAPNAKQALAASKLEKAYRIERDVVSFHNLVQIDKLTKATGAMERMEQPAEAAAPAEPQEAPSAAAPLVDAKSESPKEEVPLSSEDVDKLLKG